MRTLPSPHRGFLAACLLLLAAPAPAADCIGDCNKDGHVRVDELVVAVDIGLGSRATTDCPMLDADVSDDVSIAELVGAVHSLLDGCPGTPTPTGTATPTASPTPTATLNVPPDLPSPLVYRTYPDFAVALPLFLDDPNGDQVVCSSDSLPDGAAINDQGLFEWMPNADQLGPFYVPYRCTDDATPPNSANGELILKVQPRDTCVIPTCDPAFGCADSLPPLDQACCSEEPTERVAEPQAGCPEGRVVFVGGNLETGFGRLQNCDKLRMRVQAQSGAEVRLNVKTRCINTNNRVMFRVRMETSSPGRPLAFDFGANLLRDRHENGFDHYFQLSSAIDGGGPFFDLEDAEANLIVTATEFGGGNSVSQTIRVILTSTPIPDLPDLDPTPAMDE